MEYLIDLGFFAVGLSIMSFFAKKIFESYLSKRLEVHKIELNNLAKKNEIKFTRLHAERALVIKDLYPLIIELREIFDLIDEENSEDWSLNDYSNVKSKTQEIEKFYKHNKILFSNHTCKIIDDFFDLINETLLHKFTLVADDYGITKNKINWLETNMRYYEGLEEIKNTLEEEFRSLIGTETVD